MAFYKNPIIEAPPECLVCSVVVTDGSLICSATCDEIMTLGQFRRQPELDWENLGDFIAQQHEPGMSWRGEYA